MVLRRRDIMLLDNDKKHEWYEKVHKLWLKGKKVKLSEHKSGFPAITIDCEDIHLLTDCLSLEEWWHKLPPERKEQKRR
jgi:hypothetical protein